MSISLDVMPLKRHAYNKSNLRNVVVTEVRHIVSVKKYMWWFIMIHVCGARILPAFAYINIETQ